VSERARWWVYATLIAYAAGFVLFPPRVLLIIDEYHYVAQSLAFARGLLTIPGAAPLVPPATLRVASDYPPGTSLLQAPLVALVGWQGAPALAMLSLVAATLVTMKWLREQGREPVFALLVPAFAGSLLFGRVAMSDVPSAAWIALALWALFRADRGAWWSLLAGLLAGASVLFRETNAVLLAPFLVGAIARRKCHSGALTIGAVLGVGARLGASAALFGTAFYVRDSGYGFSLASIWSNGARYAVILLLLFPLGALLPFLYRGPRRAEFVASFCAYVAVYLSYDYGGAFESGRARALLLASRFVVPLVPLLAFMAADVWPRWFAALSERWQSAIRRASPTALSAVAAAAFLIHPMLQRRERDQLSIIRSIREVAQQDVPVITNHQVTLKYLSPVYGARPMILRSYITPDDVPSLYRRYGKLNVVFLDRDDSEMFRADAKANAAFLEGAGKECRLQALHDSTQVGMRLQIYAIAGCASR
jgi:hypothetical protein